MTDRSTLRSPRYNVRFFSFLGIIFFWVFVPRLGGSFFLCGSLGRRGLVWFCFFFFFFSYGGIVHFF